MISKSDQEILERAVKTDKYEGKKTDILELCSLLGYKINREFLLELTIINDYELTEFDITTMVFYTHPDDTNSRPSSAIKRKLKEVGDDFDLVALSYKLRDKSIKQESDGLVKRRIKLPIYMAKIVKGTGLINCKTNKEILEYNLIELIDMFK